MEFHELKLKNHSAERRKKNNLVRYRIYHNTYMKQYRKKHPDRMKEADKRWRDNHIESARANQNIRNSIRRRNLSTEMVLNEPFARSQLHHMTPSVAAYIPTWLHRSIRHNVITGLNMGEINTLAGRFISNNIQSSVEAMNSG
jgi:hypothetical protein